MADDEHTIEYSVVVTGDVLDHERFRTLMDEIEVAAIESEHQADGEGVTRPANDVLATVESVFAKHGDDTTEGDVQEALKSLFYVDVEEADNDD